MMVELPKSGFTGLGEMLVGSRLFSDGTGAEMTLEAISRAAIAEKCMIAMRGTTLLLLLLLLKKNV